MTIYRKEYENMGLQWVCENVWRKTEEYCKQYTSIDLDKTNFVSDNDVIAKSELQEIIAARQTQRHQSQYIFNGSDFLPINKLYDLAVQGTKLGSPVCRLVRDYTFNLDVEPSQTDINDFIKSILAAESESRLTLEELSSWLSIEADFWRGYPTCKDAFNDPVIKDKFYTKLIRVPVGTGFLIGKNYLLTNNHVIKNQDDIGKFIVQFLYEEDVYGNITPVIEYKLDPNYFIKNVDENLDYTIVKLADLEAEEKSKLQLVFPSAGNNFGWLPLIEDNTLIAPPYPDEVTISKDRSVTNNFKFPGESVVIIQHPRGRKKEIVVFNNRVQSLYHNFLQYDADTDMGSSGSPIFNIKGQLVGLHQAALFNGNQLVGNLGIRINRIVEDIKKQVNNNDVQELVNKYMLVKENNYQISKTKKIARVFLVANYVDDDLLISNLDISKASAKKDEIIRSQISEITKKVNDKLSTTHQDFEVILVPDNLDSQKSTIDFINNISNYDTYEIGDIALQIYAVNYEYQPRLRGTGIYYIGNQSQRKFHAEKVLYTLLKETPGLVNRGAKSDTTSSEKDRGAKSDITSSEKGLAFCRDVIMPSLRLRLGFASNSDDWDIMQNQPDKIAEGIANGLKSWVNLISPYRFLDY